MLDDFRTAPISEKARAMIGFLEKMTLAPDDLGPDDAAKVRAVGVSDAAMLDAIHVAFAFNVITRIADTFRFALLDEKGWATSAKMLLRFGYE